MRAFTPKGWQRPILTSTQPGLKSWEQEIRHAASLVLNGERYEGPVAVYLTFYFDRPKSLPKRVRWHLKKPDLDKLTRAVLDALTPVAWKDDAIVTTLVARKVYIPAGLSAAPGVCIEIDDDPATKREEW